MNILKNIFRAVLTVLLIGLILYKVGPGKVLAAFQNLNWLYFLGALILTPAIIFLKGSKWFVLARAESPTFTFSETFKAFLVGLGLSIITPSRAGELGRVFYLAGGDRLRLAGLVIIDKVFDLLVVGVLSFFGAAYFLGLKVALVIVFLCLGAAFLFFQPKVIIGILKIFGRRLPFKDKLKNLVLSLNLLSPGLAGQCFLLTILSFVLMVLQFYLFLLAFGPASFGAAFLCYPLILFTNLIPLTIGNLGIREGAAVILLGKFGITQQAAVNAAFLIFFANTVVPGLIGAFFSSRIKINQKGT